MQLILCCIFVSCAVALAQADPKKLSPIQWKPDDCSAALMLPAQGYSVSQFGPGKYRIDSWRLSKGQFNNIFIFFQATNGLSPASIAGAAESSFLVMTQKVTWRSYQTDLAGRSVIRKEALLPNILPRQKKGNSSDYIAIRMDADSSAILDELTPVAEGILQDAVAVKAGP
jgi:hypothetical protein